MNDLQKVELELFKAFKAACEKLDLNYFLVCGSCLGAARQGGFIPWDDDMDVGMYREDYKKFMELAPALLPEGIFLQNYKSDPEYPFMFAKLRNSNTTYIEKSTAHLDMNHGVYLDIFPLDGYPSAPKEQKKLAFRKTYYLLKLSCGLKISRTWKVKIVAAIFRMFGCHKRTDKTLVKYEAVLSKYSIGDCERICNHGTWYGSRDFIKKEYYGVGTDILYEGVAAHAPEQYDNYLSSLYGDWRTPPPPEKQKGHHYYEVCDLKKSYLHYLKRK